MGIKSKEVKPIQENPHLGSLESFVEEHKRLVHSICNRYRAKGITIGVEYDELVSVGFIGLMKAYEKFDPIKYTDVKVSTYAVPMVKGELQRFMRDYNYGARFSRTEKETGWAIMKNEWFEKPNKEIAELLNCTLEMVIAGRNFLRNQTADSMDEVIFEDDGTGVTIQDQIGKSDDFSSITVSEFMDSLSERDKQIIELVLQGKIQSEIGEVLGVSQVQVSRLLKKIQKITAEYFGIDILAKEEKVEKKVVMTVEKRKRYDSKRLRELLLEGKLSYSQIAKEIGCAEDTVAYHASKMNEKANKTVIIRTNKGGRPKQQIGDMTKAKELVSTTDLTYSEIAKITGVSRYDVTVYGKTVRGITRGKQQQPKPTEEKPTMEKTWKCERCDSAEKPEGAGPNAKLCKPCIIKAHRENRPTIDKVCEETGCETKFVAKSPNAKYCPECRVKRQEAYQAKLNTKQQPQEEQKLKPIFNDNELIIIREMRNNPTFSKAVQQLLEGKAVDGEKGFTKSIDKISKLDYKIDMINPTYDSVLGEFNAISMMIRNADDVTISLIVKAYQGLQS